MVDVLTEMLDALPIGAALYDASDDDFRVAYVNRRVETQFATDAGSLIGRTVVEAFGPPAADFIDVFREVRRTGRPWRVAEYRAGRGRSRFQIEARPIPDGPRPRHILCWWYDVTEPVAARHRAETALELALEVARPLEATQAVRRLVQRAASETQADRVALARLHGERLVLEAAHGVELPDAAGSTVMDLREVPLAQEALSAKRPVAGRLASQPGGEALLRMHRADAQLVAVPMILDGAAVGVLLLGWIEGPGFGDDELSLLELIGSHAALALHNARTADRLRLGVDMAVTLASQLEPAAVIRSLLQMTVMAMGDRATLSRVTEDELVVVDSYSDQLPSFPVGTRWRRADYPLMDTALETGKPQTGEENRDPAFFPPEIEIAAVPLQLGGLPFATMGLSRKHVPFTSDDLLTLNLIGSVAAMALRNADLFEALRETNRTKSQLMNLVAHELRGPLSVISAYLSMLDSGPVSARPATVSVLLAKVQESNELVDRMLLAARLEAGAAVATTLERLDLRALVETARDRALPRAGLTGGELSLRLPSRPVIVLTDAEQVGRVLDNLITNAFAYSGSAPRVSLEVAARAGQGEVLVRDNGPGIPPESWEAIFQQFTRLDEAGPPGTGLGLFISRRLAESLGGRLDVADSPREHGGTTFRLTLPLAPP